MNGKSARRSSLFLLELMISILMFSVASAWCTRLFVAARSVVSETETQNRMQNLAAGYAEAFLASEDFEAFLLNEGAVEVEGEDQSRTVYWLWYDENCNACKKEEATYLLSTVITPEGDFEECSFAFSGVERGAEICHLLDVEKYTGGEAAL